MVRSTHWFASLVLGGVIAFVGMGGKASGQVEVPENPLRLSATSAKPAVDGANKDAEATKGVVDAAKREVETPGKVRAVQAAYYEVDRGIAPGLREASSGPRNRVGAHGVPVGNWPVDRSAHEVFPVRRGSPAASSSVRAPYGLASGLGRRTDTGMRVVSEAVPEAAAKPVPRPAVPGVPEVSEGEIVYDGAIDAIPGEAFGYGPGLPACCGGMGCFDCFCIPCPVVALRHTELFGGVQGFTGPANRGETGSFGFHEGFNWGLPVPCTAGALGAQFGIRAVQANLSGAEFSDENRNQIFMTGGIFRRVDWGWQCGVAVDYLSDDWYANTDVVQLRGEASWVFPCTHELGFWFTKGTTDDMQISRFSGAVEPQLETWEPLDLYAFFYRRHFPTYEGAEARFFAGFSGHSDGLLGADLSLPLGCDFALKTGFTYLVPQEATGSTGRGHEHESWNVGITLVWYPGTSAQCDPHNYFRPLFDVADNGNFMVDRR